MTTQEKDYYMTFTKETLVVLVSKLMSENIGYLTKLRNAGLISSIKDEIDAQYSNGRDYKEYHSAESSLHSN